MKIESDSIADGGRIPGEFCFCLMHESSRVCLGGNRNPHLRWAEVPTGTRSFCLIVHDPDVPSVGDDVNQEGRSVPASLPRVDFFHWVVADIPPDVTEVAAGTFSAAVTPRGKSGPTGPLGTRQGINDYTAWFSGDADMSGDYYGYDGPCPPWNDERPHRYVFTVFALDVGQLALPARFSGNELRAAMAGHVLADAALTGRYTLNPAVNL